MPAVRGPQTRDRAWPGQTSSPSDFVRLRHSALSPLLPSKPELFGWCLEGSGDPLTPRGECVQGCLDLSHLLSELGPPALHSAREGGPGPARPAPPRPAPVRLAACDVGGSQAQPTTRAAEEALLFPTGRGGRVWRVPEPGGRLRWTHGLSGWGAAGSRRGSCCVRPWNTGVLSATVRPFWAVRCPVNAAWLPGGAGAPLGGGCWAPLQLGGAARGEGALPLLRWHPVLREMLPGRGGSASCGRSARAGAGLRLVCQPLLFPCQVSGKLLSPLPASLRGGRAQDSSAWFSGAFTWTQVGWAFWRQMGVY